MMDTVKILILTLIVGVAVSEFNIEENANDNSPQYHADQFVGSWHMIAVVRKSPSDILQECVTLNVKEKNDTAMDMSFHVMVNGVQQSYDWAAVIHNDKIYNLSHNISPNPEIHSIDSYHANETWVAHDPDSRSPYIIYSRSSTVSNNLLRNYRNIAILNNWYLEFVDNRNCDEKNRIEHESDKIATDAFVGTWYMVLEICPIELTYDTSCAHMNITKGKYDYLEIVTEKKHDERLYYRQWKARIFKSKLIEVNNNVANVPIFFITYYNDGNEVFLKDSKGLACQSIWTKERSLSQNSLENYKKMAQSKNAFLKYINHENCY